MHARYGDFRAVIGVAACDDVELSAASPASGGSSQATSNAMHLSRARVSLHAAPDGPIVIDLEARHGGATFDVTESRGAWRHVRYDDGVRIDGWIRSADLASGAGPDCDDCHGDIIDVDDACPPRNGCPDERGGPFHARRRVAVRDRPSPEGEPLGWLEEDGEVRIVARNGSYARVEALRNELTPPSGGLWIDEATLDPRAR